jgi:hypothetical protein
MASDAARRGRAALVIVAVAALAMPSLVSAQRRGRARAPRSPFVTALIEHASLDADTAARVEERVRAAVHRTLRNPRSGPTNIVLRSLMNDGLSYVEASARVEELAGRDAASADIVGALARYFTSADLASCATVGMGLGLRVQECEVARAAVTGRPPDHAWEPGDGRAWADELETRGMRRDVARTLASVVSGRMINILRRPGAGVGAQALFQACPVERFAAVERFRLWDAGASPEMMHCIARWLETARSRDGAALALSQALGLSLSDALRLHDVLNAYERGGPMGSGE